MKGPVCFGEGPECSEERPGGREGGEQENIHQPVLLLKPSASPGQAASGTLISSFCPQLNESPFQGLAPTLRLKLQVEHSSASLEMQKEPPTFA